MDIYILSAGNRQQTKWKPRLLVISDLDEQSNIIFVVATNKYKLVLNRVFNLVSKKLIGWGHIQNIP